MNVRIFTHTDLDGWGCGHLLSKCYPNSRVTKCENPNTLNIYIKNMIASEDHLNYDHVFIADLSVSEEVAELLNGTLGVTGSITLLDHHKNIDYLKAYKWALVDSNGSQCGTSLVYNFIKTVADNISKNTRLSVLEANNHVTVSEDEQVSWLVELITLWDTWNWTRENRTDASDLAKVFSFLGWDRFDNMVSNNDQDQYETYIELADESVQKVFNNTILVPFEVQGAYVGYVCHCNSYTSEIAQMVKEETGADLVVLVDSKRNTVSLRSEGDIDVSLIARKLGGGGHKNSAGYPLNHKYNKILDFGDIALLNKVIKDIE